MSTKNLARTAIEGGRYYSASWFCRYENGALRTSTRGALAGLVSGNDPDGLAVPHLTRVGRCFRDKLGPPERWLASQVGRPWDLVRGELVRKFDTRTTAGRHIVFDHMFPWVDQGGDCGHHLFVVDAHGLLRRVHLRRLRWYRPMREPLPRPEHELCAWLGGRRVGARGNVLFWFAPSATGGYRQHHRLDDADAALWRSLPDWFRACHDSFAPRPNTERRS
jgi:hypothetical protein